MNCLRLIVLLFICSLASHTFGQTTDVCHLLLRMGSCRPTAYLDPYSPDSIRFFKLPENQLVTTVVSRIQRKFPIEVAVPKADYRIVYRNMFGQPVEKNLHLYNDSVTELAFCPDSLTTYTENTLAKLKNNERLTIACHSSGCFHDNIEKIILTRMNGRLTARLYGDSTEYYLKEDSVHSRQRTNVLLKRKTLTPEDSLAFIGFENELRMVHKGGCTTQDYYVVQSKYWNLQTQDGACRWGGYYRLKLTWFGPPDPETAEFISKYWPSFNKFAHDH